MVENFRFISGGGNVFKPNITPNKGDSLFKFISDKTYKEYVNNSTQGVEWYCFGQCIKIYEEGMSIFALPTPNMQRVVAIYPMANESYRAPCNAIIYNADGSIYMQLRAPEPMSELAKTRARSLAKSKKFNPPLRLYFYGVNWKQVNDKVETVIKIGFDRDWWEERVLNPNTGEFGECISSGRI